MSGTVRTALVAGVTGAVGSALARELARSGKWRVLGLARRAPATPVDGVAYVETDMSEPDALDAVASKLTNVTHLYYCARATHTEQTLENVPGNLALLRHVLDATAAASSDLQHVHIVQGGKYYGVHVGPFSTPAREDQARAPIENFNYAHQDFLAERARDARWRWSASRPNTLMHCSPDNARNLVSSLGAYAALCQAMNAALDFPGVAGAYTSLTQVTTLSLLAKAIVWMSTASNCANEAFNVVNTDAFRWGALWPRLAECFDIPAGGVRPMRLATVLAGREDTWRQLCERKGLRITELRGVANWGFVDATLERYWDEVLSHNKLRRFGFNGWDDSEERFFSVLEAYRDARILP